MSIVIFLSGLAIGFIGGIALPFFAVFIWTVNNPEIRKW